MSNRPLKLEVVIDHFEARHRCVKVELLIPMSEHSIEAFMRKLAADPIIPIELWCAPTPPDPKPAPKP